MKRAEYSMKKLRNPPKKYFKKNPLFMDGGGGHET
jgi:hypothetical protein